MTQAAPPDRRPTGNTRPRALSSPGPVISPAVRGLIRGAGRGPDAISDAQFNNRTFDDAALNAAATALRNERGTKKSKQLKSEAMGEQGALVYLRAHTGYADIGLHRASPEDSHKLPTTQGYRWPNAVAFNGAHVADISYWDGQQLHVIEAKGGGAKLGQRSQLYFQRAISVDDWLAAANPKMQDDPGTMRNIWKNLDQKTIDNGFQPGDMIPFAARNSYPNMLKQGTQRYLTDIGYAMTNSESDDGRSLIGTAILQHSANLHYQAVNTKLADRGVTMQTLLG